MPKKAIVTGGAGFIGSHLVDALIKKGFQVLVIDDLSIGKKSNINPQAKLRQLDIRSSKIKQEFIKFKPNFVFHLAAQINMRRALIDPIFDADVNVMGSLNVMKAALESKAEKFIFASSGGGICDDTCLPGREHYNYDTTSPYGVAKFAVDKYLYSFNKKYGLNYVSLRQANIYGPRQDPMGEAGIIAIIMDKIKNNDKFTIFGNGKQTRDYLYIDDLIRAYLLSMRKKAHGLYNVGTNKETSVLEISKLICKYMGQTCQRRFDSKADFGEKRSFLDYSKIKNDLGWKPQVKIEEGIKKTVEWFKANQ